MKTFSIHDINKYTATDDLQIQIQSELKFKDGLQFENVYINMKCLETKLC